MPTDEELVVLILKRDAHAFELLFERYKDAIRRHVASILRDAAATQDVTQEVYLRLWTRAEQWHRRGPFRAWLYRIATNLALNHLRSTRRRRELPLTVPDEWGDEEEYSIPAWMIEASASGPDEVLELAERRAALRRLVDRLPQAKREAFRLVHELEMSMQDAADELGIPAGTVKSRLFYAKRRLARQWRQQEPE